MGILGVRGGRLQITLVYGVGSALTALRKSLTTALMSQNTLNHTVLSMLNNNCREQIEMKNFRELPNKLYKILNTETNKYWTTGHGKTIWAKPADAKGAWTLAHYMSGEKFNNQARYIIMEFEAKQWEMREYQETA